MFKTSQILWVIYRYLELRTSNLSVTLFYVLQSVMFMRSESVDYLIIHANSREISTKIWIKKVKRIDDGIYTRNIFCRTKLYQLHLFLIAEDVLLFYDG